MGDVNEVKHGSEKAHNMDGSSALLAQNAASTSLVPMPYGGSKVGDLGCLKSEILDRLSPNLSAPTLENDFRSGIWIWLRILDLGPRSGSRSESQIQVLDPRPGSKSWIWDPDPDPDRGSGSRSRQDLNQRGP